MKTITVLNRFNLKLYLKKKYLKGSEKGIYFCCQESSPKLCKFLEENGYRKAETSKYDKADEAKFIQEYIDLIAAVGKDNNKKEWWATDLASKNRFTSNLPILLQQFLTIIEIAKNQDFEHFIILDPSWVIIPSLRKVMKENGIRIRYQNYLLRKWSQVSYWVMRKFAGVIAGAAVTYLKGCYARIQLGQVLKRKIEKQKLYYVITTFILNNSFTDTNAYKDIYFNRLIEFLKAKKKNIITYAIILGDYKYCIKRIKKCLSHAIIPAETLLSLGDLFEAVGRRLFFRVEVSKELTFFKFNVSDLVRNELLRTINGVQIYQFLHYWFIKELLDSGVSIESFLLTHEGNPWEKMCIESLRKHSSETKILGYQHTIVAQASMNMFVSQQDAAFTPLPDKIFTVGDIPRKIIERYSFLDPDCIESSCGLRFEYLFNETPFIRKKTGNILIALEGIEDAHKLIEYAMRQLGNAKYKVIIRTHPVLPWGYFRRKYGYDLSPLSNFKVSENQSLKNDLDWADIVVYWGSTVALEALSKGLAIVHYDMNSVLSYDPLFECDHLKWVVFNDDALAKKIEEIYSLSDEEFYLQREKAKEYLESYFHRINESSLEKFCV